MAVPGYLQLLKQARAMFLEELGHSISQDNVML